MLEEEEEEEEEEKNTFWDVFVMFALRTNRAKTFTFSFLYSLLVRFESFFSFPDEQMHITLSPPLFNQILSLWRPSCVVDALTYSMPSADVLEPLLLLLQQTKQQM